MSKPVARYSVFYGMSGCYLPDSHAGVYECHTRRDLAAIIRDMIEMYDLPKSKFQDVGINRLWSFIKVHGSSTAHFSLHHNGFTLHFSGLTADEYKEASESESF